MPFTVFQQLRKITDGTKSEVAHFLKDVPQGGGLLVFDDTTGRQVDLDMRAPLAEGPMSYSEETGEPRGRGRPRLGVVPREVTLLPRHWDWLNSRPGGASVALRKLVEDARRNSGDRDRIREAQESTYHFISAIAGNLPGFEEATRALFAYDRRRFGSLIAGWPDDIRDYAIRLAFADQKQDAG